MKALKIGYKFVLVMVLLSACTMLLSCGGDSMAADPPAPVVAVSISPTTASMVVSTTQSFTATVTGTSNTAVTWSANLGTITGTGSTVTYTAPSTVSAFQFPVITVTSVADTTKSATASITVVAGATVSVSVSPSSTLLGPNATKVFTATTLNSTNTAVTWTATGGTLSAAPAGSLADSIQYTAPAATGSYTVTATSVADPTKSSTATVTVVSLAISPTNPTILTGGQQVFNVVISGGSGISLAYSASAGTVVGSGTTATYTAPAAPGVYTVTASVVGNPLITAVATVNVSQLAISPATVTLLTSGTRTQLFTTTVSGGLSSAVTFSASAGTVVPAGTTATYTAPNAAGTYTVTATSVANPAISATATVTVILPSVTLFEVDGVTQTNRPVTFGRVFAQGDVPLCPQPIVGAVAGVGGTPAANWQADVKNRWPDGSVKFAIISFVQTLAPISSTQVTFQSVAPVSGGCNNTGFLTAATMASFNSGNWGAQTVVTPVGGAAVTTDAKTMLAASDPGANTLGDCKNDYWLQGPVVTAVIVQDCTAASASDFGWTWNGTTMTSLVTGNDPHASLHPMFILYFYPGSNNVQVESILENPWTGRVQDQSISLAIKTGSSLAQVFSKSTFPMYAGMRIRKNFWSGTAPGHIRIDHNFAYLKFTKALPNYDSSVTASTATQDGGSGATSWATWSVTDKGDIGGTGGFNAWDTDYSGNSEGAPLQREDLLYLYNMNTCGQANGECARAWDMLTGEIGSIDTSLSAGSVSGGGGAWNNLGNVTFHVRDSRTAATGNQSTTNNFYCPSFADKNAPVDTTNCGVGAGVATGRVLSRHAHSGDQFSGSPSSFGTVGATSSSGWSIGGCHHWLDYAYTPYLLTGSYYYLENEYQSAALCVDSQNPDPNVPYGGAKIFGFLNHGGNTIRETAWGLQTVSRAAFISPDGQPEASYFNAMVESTLEIEEGVLGVVGTHLTPADTSCSAATCSFTAASANRWNWGRAAVASACAITGTCTTLANPLHAVAQGFCDTTNQGAFLNYAITDTYYEPWHYNWMNIVLSEMRELGFGNAAGVSDEMHKSLEEMVLDTTFNPYLVGAYLQPVHDTASNKGCDTNGYSRNPYISTYARLKIAFATTIPNQATFDGFSSSRFYSGNPDYSNASCGDHGYSLGARAAGSFLQEFGTSSTDANCPGGTCTAAATWNWLNAEIPFFSNPLSHNGGAAVSTSCTSPLFPGQITDQQIKFALAPR